VGRPCRSPRYTICECHDLGQARYSAAVSRAVTASARRETSAFFGSNQAGTGMRSILRRFRLPDTTVTWTPGPRGVRQFGPRLGPRLRPLRHWRCAGAPARAVSGDLEDLGPPAATQVQSPSTQWPGLKLTIDVGKVGATHDNHVHTRQTERLDTSAHLGGVGLPIGHSGTVPVKDDRLERLVENLRAEVTSLDGRASRHSHRQTSFEQASEGPTPTAWRDSCPSSGRGPWSRRRGPCGRDGLRRNHRGSRGPSHGAGPHFQSRISGMSWPWAST